MGTPNKPIGDLYGQELANAMRKDGSTADKLGRLEALRKASKTNRWAQGIDRTETWDAASASGTPGLDRAADERYRQLSEAALIGADPATKEAARRQELATFDSTADVRMAGGKTDNIAMVSAEIDATRKAEKNIAPDATDAAIKGYGMGDLFKARGGRRNSLLGGGRAMRRNSLLGGK